jgi:hypothetical protein
LQAEGHRFDPGTLHFSDIAQAHRNAGGYLLSRDLGTQDGTLELTPDTFWRSPAAIGSFAGAEITASIVEPEAQAFLLDFDATATHRDVWVDASS